MFQDKCYIYRKVSKMAEHTNKKVETVEDIIPQQLSESIKNLGMQLAEEIEGTDIAGKAHRSSNRNNKSNSNEQKNQNTKSIRKNNNGVQNSKNAVKVNAEPSDDNVPKPPSRRKGKVKTRAKQTNPYATAVPADTYEDSKKEDMNEGSSSYNSTAESSEQSMDNHSSDGKSSNSAAESSNVQNNRHNNRDAHKQEEVHGDNKNYSQQGTHSDKQDAYADVNRSRQQAKDEQPQNTAERNDSINSKNNTQANYSANEEPEEPHIPQATDSRHLKEKMNEELQAMKKVTEAVRKEFSDSNENDDDFFAAFDKLDAQSIEQVGKKVTRDEVEELKKKTGAKATLIINTRVVDTNGNLLNQETNLNEPVQLTYTPKKRSARLISLDTGEIYDISSNYVAIGKGPGVDCKIKEHYISRRHCIISKNNEMFFLEDTKSTNGTYINERRIERGEIVELKDNDIIKLANIEFKFEIVEE